MLSDAIKEYGNNLDPGILKVLAYASLKPSHAAMFLAFIKQIKNRYLINE